MCDARDRSSNMIENAMIFSSLFACVVNEKVRLGLLFLIIRSEVVCLLHFLNEKTDILIGISVILQRAICTSKDKLIASDHM